VRVRFLRSRVRVNAGGSCAFAPDANGPTSAESARAPRDAPRPEPNGRRRRRGAVRV